MARKNKDDLNDNCDAPNLRPAIDDLDFVCAYPGDNFATNTRGFIEATSAHHGVYRGEVPDAPCQVGNRRRIRRTGCRKMRVERRPGLCKASDVGMKRSPGHSQGGRRPSTAQSSCDEEMRSYG